MPFGVNVNLNLSNNPVHLVLLIDSFIMLLSILHVNNSSFMGQPRSQGSLLPVPTERESTGRREPGNSPFIIGTFEKLAPGLQLGTGGKLVLSKYPRIKCPS